MAIREEEVVLDARIALLEEALDRASVVSGAGVEPDVVAIGSTVLVEEPEFGSRDRYRVVGMRGQIRDREVSAGSPIGRALLGRRCGETSRGELPNGRVRELLIVAITVAPAAGRGDG
jgi:transcription elongation factor GreA